MKTKQPGPLEPQIGIFWLEGIHLHASAVPLGQGMPYGECVNGPDDHVDFWPRLQREHPHLRGLEYFAVPRGRVIYDRPADTFRVFMDRRLHTPAAKAVVLDRFQLPRCRTRFLTDAHYTTDPVELERLFDRAAD